jgi:imidazole glycerol-phosphate synthase subunit HisH
MITIVDYGLGNVQAFLNVYKRLNVEARTASTAADLAGATKIILPGVGAFDHAMERLQASGMRGALDALVLEERVPALGVCVGMQMLAHASDEGRLPGLGWIPGRVRHLSALAPRPPEQLPHMGWNDVAPANGGPLFADLEAEARFYFLHSYYFECDRAQDVAAVTTYGCQFACAVASGNIHGVQFHPEKSHHFGTTLLKNFAEL